MTGQQRRPGKTAEAPAAATKDNLQERPLLSRCLNKVAFQIFQSTSSWLRRTNVSGAAPSSKTRLLMVQYRSSRLPCNVGRLISQNSKVGITADPCLCHFNSMPKMIKNPTRPVGNTILLLILGHVRSF